MSVYAVFLLPLFFLFSQFSWSGQSLDHDDKLTKNVYDILIKYNYCSGVQDCKAKELVLGESGDGSIKNFYGISDIEVINHLSQAAFLRRKESEGRILFTFYPYEKSYYIKNNIIFLKSHKIVELEIK